jgi:hypothetical protein
MVVTADVVGNGVIRAVQQRLHGLLANAHVWWLRPDHLAKRQHGQRERERGHRTIEAARWFSRSGGRLLSLSLLHARGTAAWDSRVAAAAGAAAAKAARCGRIDIVNVTVPNTLSINT